MKNFPATALLLGALLFVSASTAFASDMSDGNAAYSSGGYAAATADYQKAAGELTGPEQAKAYYKLGLAYDKQPGHTSEALTAYQQAKTIDPSESFATNPASFERKMARDAGNGGTAPAAAAADNGSAAGGTSNAGGSADPVLSALTTSDVYVDPSLTSSVDAVALEDAAKNDSHTTVKVAMLPGLPAWWLAQAQQSGISGPDALRGEYTKRLHDQLDLGKDALVVVITQGPDGGIAVNNSTLSIPEESELSQHYVADIQSGNYNKAVPALAEAVAGKIDAKERFWPDIFLTLFLVAVIIVAYVLIRRSQSKKAAMDRLRGPLDRTMQAILENIEYVDGYTGVLPKNNADTDQVKAFRQSAAARVEQARKIIVRATEISDLQRASDILRKASDDSTQSRRFLDRATGGTAHIPGDDAIQPAALPKSQPEVEAVPADKRAVSFFSSRPAPISQLVPVKITIDGTERTVMATPAEAADIQRGHMPPVRSFTVGGQTMPWYAYNQYDPYRDYWNYNNSGWGGGGGGNFVTGFIAAELFDSLLSPSRYGGYGSPYAYAPGWDSYGGWNNYDQGYYSDLGDQQAHDYAFQDQNSNPGSGQSGSYDQSDYGSGGAGFLGGNTSGDNS